ncbi:MBL fold metallo-hydrolase [Sphingobacterium deserti]|uniref:Beta-lactamase domain protein n=1 Tax=Sphingobacterium deserti TaxID=1229276 RepID=A0A0B8T6I7_9SPHI|nr:MBL fold metallo-hydrolase [Sphingobacterium deserti]KGE12870.1 beta-lactamase domain protein [Sphingobacterium deserti]
MFFQQIYDKTLSQASYFVGCQATKEAIVIDAKRDVDTYLEIAKQQHMQITHVVETHIHADFLSGTRELATLTAASIYLSDEGDAEWQYQFPHVGLSDGSIIKVGNLSLEIMHTPGHTPESISLLLRDHSASDEPVMIFTGDFVFVGDVGRPDLLEEVAGVVGSREQGARALFNSLQKFIDLPDYVQVWPGHGAGSACGKALGAVPCSTVGYEKIRNWALQYAHDYRKFEAYLLQDQPEVPRYFATMKKLNRMPRPLLTKVPVHPLLNRADLSEEDLIIDARHKTKFAAAHIKGSLNIQHNNSMATWIGSLLDATNSLAIIAEEEEHEAITRKLMRIGFDRIVGFISTVSDADAQESVQLLTSGEVEEMMTSDDYLLVDVRSRQEYDRAHIPGAIHSFVGHLYKEDLQKFAGRHIILYCQAGDRASVAYSYLASRGVQPLSVYPGSFQEWQQLGKLVTA